MRKRDEIFYDRDPGEYRESERYDRYLSLLVVILIALGIIGLAVWAYQTPGEEPLATEGEQFIGTGGPALDAGTITTRPSAGELANPINNPTARVTRESFGTQVTPDEFPENVREFEGYHTGVDFEVLPGEDNRNIAVSAVCDGEITSAKTATGYGGVVTQSCTLDDEPVTVIYGHVRLSSVAGEVGDELKAGDFLAYLGETGSTDTDGERKHLHLGIYRGDEINIMGYVESKNELENWLDPMEYLR